MRQQKSCCYPVCRVGACPCFDVSPCLDEHGDDISVTIPSCYPERGKTGIDLLFSRQLRRHVTRELALKKETDMDVNSDMVYLSLPKTKIFKPHSFETLLQPSRVASLRRIPNSLLESTLQKA
jgi:hypothetical protein